jgi:putative ABC transport system permease protein
MWKNYIKTAFRNIKRHKLYSGINILGLSIGLSSVILISMFLKNELSYDAFHKNSDNIYRVVTHIQRGDGNTLSVPSHSGLLADELTEKVSEFETVCKIENRTSTFVTNNKRFPEVRFYLADETFFDLFSFRVKEGNAKEALSNPNTLVLTESFARRMFGNKKAIGQELEVNEKAYTVSAILEDLPPNTHFSFEALSSFKSVDNLVAHLEGSGLSTKIYFRTKNNSAPEVWKPKYEKVCEEFLKPALEEAEVSSMTIKSSYQSLKDIHLYSDLQYDLAENGDIQDVYVFSIIALFIIIIAVINYVNLVTAKSENRYKEIGIRKVSGALKKNLIFQFLGESFLMVLLAITAALFITEQFLPVFNNIFQTQIELHYNDWQFLSGLSVLAIIITLLSGLYPAFVLSKLIPVQILKGSKRSERNSVRKYLVTLQFGITILLVGVLLVVNLQLKYVKNKDLGFNSEQVVVLSDLTPELKASFGSLKNELLKQPDINQVASSSFVPGKLRGADMGYIVGEKSPNQVLLKRNYVTPEFFETYDIQFQKGRSFHSDLKTDSTKCVLNESALRHLGINDALHRELNILKERKLIIGIVKDYHFASLHYEVEPMVFSFMNDKESEMNFISVKIDPSQVKSTLNKMKQVVQSYDENYIFNYSFADESFSNQYQNEERMGLLVLSGSVLAIIISLLGIFALAAFTVAQKRKEIGIRKVMGASAENVTWLLVKNINQWVIMANLIAWPFAYWFSTQWLNGFAFRIDLSFWIFIVSGLVALIISVLTTGVQALRAANTNPAYTLRDE